MERTSGRVNSSVRSLGASVLLVLLAAHAVHAQSAPTTKPAARPTGDDIATVGTRHVPRAQYEARVQNAANAFQARNGSEIPSAMTGLFHREVLEGMIRTELLILEAKRRGLTGTEAEADEVLKRDPFFNPGGQFDPAKFAAVKAANTPTYQQAVAELKLQLGGQKLERTVEQEKVPSDSLLRGVAMRSLSRVSLDYLDVDPRRFDGHYPEPTERQILEYYRGHAAEFRRGARAEISIVFVDRPSLADSLRRIPGQMKAWDALLRTRADSALTALRGGAPFEAVAERFGGARTGLAVLPDNFPGFWLGSREQSAAVFQAKPGTFLSEPVQSNPGYLVVRVDSHVTDHFASLSEVSPEIRRRLRDDARQHGSERELTALYAQLGDSLRATAVRVRYATADTARMAPGEPTDADLDRFYRGHLADYSTFDSRSGEIHSLPLADVRSEVRLRWLHDRRGEMAQSLAEALLRVWSAGKRDAALERSATTFRDVGPAPIGSPPDSGLAAEVLGDSLIAYGPTPRTSLAPYAAGFVVFQIYQAIPNYRPTLEQARPALASVMAQRQNDRDRAAARAWFDQDPSRWQSGNTLNLGRFIIPAPNLVLVPLSRAEVERYYRDHFDDYTAPEVVHARHILISPTGPGPEADRVARARADSLLAVLRGGADFSTVARATTDDPATRPLGGDLGTFGRGAMLPAVERAAFALKPSEISEPVRTTEGYHIVQCVEHLPLYAQPLAWVYANVGYDAARVKGDSLAAALADSAFRHIHSIADARATARKLGITVETNQHQIGNRTAAPDVRPYLLTLETVKPGQLFPGPYLLKGMGYAITWVDSITAPVKPIWQQVESRVVEGYRQGAAMRAVQSKLAELDSMTAAGWSLDSLGTLWGGLQQRHDVSIGTGFADLPGSRAAFDSLLFGARGGRALKNGEISGWTLIPGHYIRARLAGKSEPPPAAIATRLDGDRRAALDRAMRPYFDQLSKRYKVRILDDELNRTSLPPPPAAPPGMP